MNEFIEKLIERLEESKSDWNYDYNVPINEAITIVKSLAVEIDMGNVSDGYHTFNELYHHRAVLFSVICNANKDKAWKSKLHDTGDMYEGMFIVGIETPNGQATYHYDINPYWDMFDVKELPKAPKWDGHSPADAIERIGRLAEHNDGWIPCSERLPEKSGKYLVTQERYSIDDKFNKRPIATEVDYVEFDSTENKWNRANFIKVTAWQPLPKPYREKGEKE